MKDYCCSRRINQANRICKIIATCVVTLIMFVFKQWGKKFGMNRNQHSAKNHRVPRSAINLAYDSESYIHLFSRSKKDMSVNVSSSVVNKKESNINEKTFKVNRPVPEGDSCEFSCRHKCRNCRLLLNLTECAVCLETLQGGQIKSCPVCANVVCIGCASRLTSCAFCRSNIPAERDRALERFVDRLLLPCKNSRSGCKLFLDGENRFVHESMCNFSTTICPVGRGICGWHGTIANIQSHLRSEHLLQPLEDHGFFVQFNNFRSKIKNSDGSVYTVCLSCYDQLFVIRVILFENRLRLCFTRLGHEEAQPLTTRPIRYGVSVVIKAHGGRRMRGLVPFGKYDRESREVNVAWENLFPKEGTGWLGTCSEDLVEIDLLVKRLDEA